MGSRDLHGGNLKPAADKPRGAKWKTIPADVVSENNILYVQDVVGDVLKLDKADSGTLATVRGPLFIASHAILATNGNDPSLIAYDKILVTGVDTSAASVGDPVYIDGVAGGYSFTKPTGDSFHRVIGYVVKDSATEGSWFFDGSMGANVISGIIEVANGQASGTVALSTALNGCPVVATMNEADGVIYVISAVIAAGTLTVTLSAGTSGIRSVGYAVFAV
jgi:hypothetical protein